MKINFSDPLLLGAVGVVILCLFAGVWALKTYRNMGKAPEDSDLLPLDLDQEPPVDLEIPSLDVETPRPRAPLPVVPPAPLTSGTLKGPAPLRPMAPATSATQAAGTPPMPRDVLDRLENMNQKLGEMQAVLSKQTNVPAGAGAPAGIGQGFSPETVDKLLRIIGNVVMQVEILQRGLGTPGAETARPSAPAAPSPTQLPKL
jgi:hypothetical protein